jgi:CrcB protein
MTYFWIGIAGIVGAFLRYVLSSWVQGLPPEALFPIGTLTVNLAGCFALGWFSQWVLDKIRISPHLRSSISTGLIGSFTTFSAFSVETVQCFRQGLYGVAIAYAGASLIGGLCLVWLGAAVASGRRGKRRNG